MTAPISKAEWIKLRREATEVLPGLATKLGLSGLLLPYQNRVNRLLEDTATQVLYIEKSRRIGLTWGLAAYGALRAGRRKSAGGMDVMYISYSKEMTREFIDACAMWARAFNVAANAVEEVLFADNDKDGDTSINAFRIRFASGFEIMALSSTPRSLRGKQGCVIIDEAAFVDDLAELIKAAMAFLMWGGQVVVVSTHDGAENPFNQAVQEIRADRAPGALVRIDIDDALREGLYQRICLVKGSDWSPEAEGEWRDDLVAFYGDGADEELFCIPSQSSGAWLTTPLIESRMTLGAEECPLIRMELPPDFLQRDPLTQKTLVAPYLEKIEEALGGLDLGPLYAGGYDVGREFKGDLSVFNILSIEQNLDRRLRLSIEMRGVSWREQKLIAGMVIEHLKHRLVGVAFDGTGIGGEIAEEIGRRYGIKETEDDPGLIWIIKLTSNNAWYRDNMPGLKVAFEQGSIALLKDNDHLGDLRAIQEIRGIPKVPSTRTTEKGEGAAKSKKGGKKRHGDFAVSLALAHFASRQRHITYAYRGVGGDYGAKRDAETGLGFAHQNNRGWWRPPLGARLRGRI